MKNMINKIRFSIIFLAFVLVGCEDLIYKDQPLVLLEDQNYKDWVDYRSAELGLYALQQELVEQLIVLGELRGDLLKTSDDADPDLIDIQNFDVSSGNAYASANKFYKLISACNALVRTLEMNHPDVLEDNPSVNDYHRVYGEALCMRAWAYFNAVRIYGQIPFIPEELTNYEDVIDFVMNPGAEYYIDSGRYVYDINGLDIIDVNDTVFFPTDTVYLDTIHFETYPKRFVDMITIVDNATYDLTQRLNYVGVEHGKKDDLGDAVWESIIWTDYSKSCLLGQMAMFTGNINGALEYYEPIFANYENRFSLSTLSLGAWSSSLTTVNIDEHIYSFWFGKAKQQTHELQRLFDNSETNLYNLKPTLKAINLWETEWQHQVPTPENLWDKDAEDVRILQDPGVAGDFNRGHNVSYIYKRGDEILTNQEVDTMLLDKQNEKYVDVENRMRDVDTLVYKYTIGKEPFDNDAYVSLYRTPSIYLAASEITVYAQYYNDGTLTYLVSKAAGYLNSVRNRVGLYPKPLDVSVLVLQDPHTNKVTGIKDFIKESGGDPLQELSLKQRYYEEVVLNERAKELAFEGERFYDLMRIAQRRKDPSFLANTIADAQGKYSSEQREEVRAKLMNESNWYIPFYINTSK